jgi:hypothetical protein
MPVPREKGRHWMNVAPPSSRGGLVLAYRGASLIRNTHPPRIPTGP